MTSALALDLRLVRKRFGSTVALDGASLAAKTGSLHVLLGENGAGKTTLLRIAAGFVRQDDGEILFNGSPARWKSRADAMRSGVAIVEQHFSLVPAMTVAENVALSSTRWTSRFNAAAASASVRRIAEDVGLIVDPASVISSLGVAAQQRAEIVKALSTDAGLLILDEPTAVLTPAESDELFAWLRTFVESGRTAVVITHRIREALRHADDLTVLRQGRTVLQAKRGEVPRDDLIGAIIGERSGPARRSTQPVADATPKVRIVASLRDVSILTDARVARLQDVTLDVRAGEIIGVAGVEGSGQRELLRVLSGRLAPSRGTASIPAHTAFIPEDRHRDALVPELSLRENIAIRGLGAKNGLLDWTSIESAATKALREFDVRAESTRQTAGSLSGGNQQKLVLARELADGPQLIVAENPIRGLDVRASDEIMLRLGDARDAGAAVVLFSSDLEDLIGFANRILVCFGGLVREVDGGYDAIGRAMLGVP